MNENQQDELIHCLRCGSTHIKSDHKGFGLGKAALGGILLGPIGLLGGMVGARRIKLTCFNCGYEFTLAKYIEEKENQKYTAHMNAAQREKHEKFLAWVGVGFILLIIALYIIVNHS